MADSKKWTNKNRDFEVEILNYLNEKTSGQTITDIANGIDSTRITVSKYINGLEKEDKIFTKKIGAYTLYFSSERSSVPRNLAMGFYEGILVWLKDEITDMERFRNLGFTVAKSLPMPTGEYFEKLLPPNKTPIKKLLKYFGKVFTYYDFLFDERLKVDIIVDDEGLSAIYKLYNINLLEKPEIYNGHFYLMSGVIQSFVSSWLRQETTCKVDYIDAENKVVQFSLLINQ